MHVCSLIITLYEKIKSSFIVENLNIDSVVDSNTTYGCVIAILESPADATGISNYIVEAILPGNGPTPPPSTSDNATDLEVEICGLNLCDESYMYIADANGGNICPSITSAMLSLSSEWFIDFKVFCTVNQLKWG